VSFVDALEISFTTTSLGGCESLVQQPAVMSFWEQSQGEKAKNGIKDNMVRLN
jgi:cystathionine gamma-synthase